MHCYSKFDKRARGFTLVELMIAMAVLSIVMLGAIAIFSHLDKTWVNEELKADMQQTARVAMDSMVREMMMMGFSVPGDPGLGYDGKILEAAEDSLEYVMYTKDPNSTDPDDKALYRIRYYVSDKELHKRYSLWYNNPAQPDVDLLLADHVKSLTFDYYYQESDTPVWVDYTTFDNPSYNDDTIEDCYDAETGVFDTSGHCLEFQKNRDDIRRIKLTLQIETDKPVQGTEDRRPNGKIIPGTAKRKTITLTADISPKNLWETDTPLDTTAPEEPELPPCTDPSDPNCFTDPPLKVRDTQTCDTQCTTGMCGKLKAMWINYNDGTATNLGLRGYIVNYGVVSGTWTNTLDVKHTSDFTDENPPNAILEGCTMQYFTDDPGVAAYYVQVMAYDSSGNLSEPIELLASADPYPNVTSFAGSANDTAVTIPKPAGLSFLAVTSIGDATPEVVLTWNQSTDPNVIGYRIYRSTEDFTTYPIEETYQLTKETELGDTWTGPRTDQDGSSSGTTWEYTPGRFVDKDPTMIGCSKYYYAICPVTCDATRIYGRDSDATFNAARGGIYALAQYAKTMIEPQETTPPSIPSFSARPGWKRIFLEITWPSDLDYAYTKIFVKPGSADVDDKPLFVDENLIPDKQTNFPYGGFVNFSAGMFRDYGTSAEHSIIYNSETADLGDSDPPQLTNGESYTFVAVAYDQCGNASGGGDSTYAVAFTELCGDDPCGAPEWSDASPGVWVDADSTNLDVSTWISNAQIRIGLAWTDIDKLDVTKGLDFYGYFVHKDVSPIPADGAASGTSTAITTGEWNSYVESAGLVEGQTYYYCVRATDCVWQNITETDSVFCPEMDPDVDTPLDYSYIRANNISDCLLLEGIKPGRIQLYDNIVTTNTHEEVATTTGEFHNEVLFYIQNTSAGSLTVDKFRAVWDNPDILLASVVFGEVDGDIEETFNISASSGDFKPIGRDIVNSYAIAAGSYSGPIPVTLVFANADGTIDEQTDMRGQLLTLEFEFTNNTMPATASGSPKVGGFTTGDAFTAPFPLKIAVTGGPVINLILQNQNEPGTNPFAIYDRDTDITMPATGYESVGGQRDVEITTFVTKPSSETIDNVMIVFAATDLDDGDPTDNTFDTVTMLKVGSYFYGDIPPQDTPISGKGVWYYVLAETEQGNFARKPTQFDAFYYYKQLEFNACNEVPAAPTFLNVDDSAFLTWSSVTTYEGGYAIPGADSVQYVVYKAAGVGSASFSAMTTVDGLSYQDWQFDPATSGAATYVVAAVNTCNNESEYSDETFICPVGDTDCRVWTSDSIVYTGESLTLTITSCTVAGNGSSDIGAAAIYNKTALNAGVLTTADFGTVIVNEVGDTGVTSAITVTPTSDTSAASAFTTDGVIFATDPSTGRMEDYLEVYSALPYDFAHFGCDTTLITVIVDPCSNVPEMPTGESASLTFASSTYSLTMSWDEVTTNRDGSPAVYSTELVKYEVWYVSSAAGVADTWLGTVNPVTLTMTENSDRIQNSVVTVSGGRVSVTFDFKVAPANNKAYNYYLYAVDTCSPLPNKSNPSGSVELTR